MKHFNKFYICLSLQCIRDRHLPISLCQFFITKWIETCWQFHEKAPEASFVNSSEWVHQLCKTIGCARLSLSRWFLSNLSEQCYCCGDVRWFLILFVFMIEQERSCVVFCEKSSEILLELSEVLQREFN